jgi:hypothetical protein
MSAQRQFRRMAFVSWMLIWFGTILAVSPRPAFSGVGIVMWATAVVVQFALAARWLTRNPPSGATTRGV